MDHLAQLEDSPLSQEGLKTWLEEWESVSASHPAIKLPLRLVRVGIAYFSSRPRDESVLLQLPMEERRILREALGLPL